MAIKEVVVHKFTMGDVDDPDLYAAEPLYEWQKSTAGQWVMKHAEETPMWMRLPDPNSFGHAYIILAKLSERNLSEFYLRFDKPQK
jgi:hypothetical protein